MSFNFSIIQDSDSGSSRYAVLHCLFLHWFTSESLEVDFLSAKNDDHCLGTSTQFQGMSVTPVGNSLATLKPSQYFGPYTLNDVLRLR